MKSLGSVEWCRDEILQELIPRVAAAKTSFVLDPFKPH